MKDKEIKIVMGDNRIITRKQLFKAKEKFHEQQAKLPFEEKIAILIRLQKIVSEIKSTVR